MPDLTLTVNGADFGGWTAARVRGSIEKIAGEFIIKATEIWPENLTPRDIHPGDKCSLQVAGTTVITGSVDRVRIEYASNKHEVTITGRDATGDLVDCSAIFKTGEWKSAKLDQIARDLCKPFGIPVVVQADVGAPFPKWKIQEGETVYECLERAARLRGVLLISDGLGSLVITTPNQTPSGIVLKLGDNILRAEGDNDQSKRFSQYIVKGQRAGHDDANGEAVTSQKATATDPGTTRYRPLVVILEDQGQVTDFQARAQLEAKVRAARSLQAKTTVQGWSPPGGKPFWPNLNVHLTDQWLSIDRDLLVKDVELVLDENGTTAELGLTVADAYDVLPPKHVKGAKKGKKGGADASDLLLGGDA